MSDAITDGGITITTNDDGFTINGLPFLDGSITINDPGITINDPDGIPNDDLIGGGIQVSPIDIPSFDGIPNDDLIGGGIEVSPIEIPPFDGIFDSDILDGRSRTGTIIDGITVTIGDDGITINGLPFGDGTLVGSIPNGFLF